MSKTTLPHGHIRTSAGAIPESALVKSVAHHARQARLVDPSGVVRDVLITTRHTEYHHNGSLVRRDVHINALPNDPHIAHDAKGDNEPLQKRIADIFERNKKEGPGHYHLALYAAGNSTGLTLPDPFEDALREARRRLAILAGITSAALTSFKVELMKAVHDFTNGSDVFKLALFKEQALLTGTYDAGTTGYAQMTGNNDEIPNGAGYTTGGVSLTNTTPTSTGVIAFTTPSAAAQWVAATFKTRGAMCYNSSKVNRGWWVYDFGADESVVSGTLTISFPANTSVAAMFRF